MAKPRVFVSSTYYDLKHIRDSLFGFIKSFGFEPVLSEKGNIPYLPDLPLDQSCYCEVKNCDIFIIIIGGRYGMEISKTRNEEEIRSFYERYDSITKQEYLTAISNNIPSYILVEKPIFNEYRTFLANTENKEIKYVQVDSVNIFYLLRSIDSQKLNNPLFQFDNYTEIEIWLKEQWSGLFLTLLNRMFSQQEISSLSEKVSELTEITSTLRKYLEKVISSLDPQGSDIFIKKETDRLEEATRLSKLSTNRLFRYLEKYFNINSVFVRDALSKSSDSDSFFQELINKYPSNEIKSFIDLSKSKYYSALMDDLNFARKILGLPLFEK